MISSPPIVLLDACVLYPAALRDLLVHLLSTDEDAVVKLMSQHRVSLRNPPKSAVEYLETLEQQRLLRSVQVLRSHLAEL